MNLRILFVTAMYPHPEHEGYGAFVKQQVEQLRELGHTVEVLAFPGYRSKLEYLKAGVAVFRRTRAQSFDVIHAHYGVTGLTALSRRSGALVVSLHGSDVLAGWLEPLISRWVCKFADGTIAVSQQIAQRIPAEVIPCGVDLGLFAPKPREQARQRLKLSAGRKYVLFPFDPKRPVKRFDLANGAIQNLVGEGMDVELLTVSRVPYTEMPWYYSAADVMILCSDSEGSPTSVKEALACNLPVVSRNVGDVSEILAGIVGVEMAEPDVSSIAAAIKRVLSRPETTGFDGRTAMQRYSQRATGEAIVHLYERVWARRSRLAQTGLSSGCQRS